MNIGQYLTTAGIEHYVKYMLFLFLCLLLSGADECGGVSTPPPPIFEISYKTTGTNTTKFSFKSTEKIFLNSILVTETISGFRKTINFDYPYPITNAGENKMIDEYKGVVSGKFWGFTFNGQSIQTGYGFQVADSLYIY